MFNWESAQLLLSYKSYISDELRLYARSKFFWHFFFRPDLLSRAIRQMNYLHATSTNDIDYIVKEQWLRERNKLRPPIISPVYGWSPFSAEHFMKALDLSTADFHQRRFDQFQWHAASETKYRERFHSIDSIKYQIFGVRDIVTELELVGHTDAHKFSREFIDWLSMHMIELIKNADFQISDGEDIRKFLLAQKPTPICSNIYRLELDFDFSDIGDDCYISIKISPKKKYR